MGVSSGRGAAPILEGERRTWPGPSPELEAARGALPGSSSSLTTAELRLVPLLATQLSFREIGERLFVSQNTVKTQPISVYRKLGASSRSEAVQRLQDLGLLGA